MKFFLCLLCFLAGLVGYHFTPVSEWVIADVGDSVLGFASVIAFPVCALCIFSVSRFNAENERLVSKCNSLKIESDRRKEDLLRFHESIEKGENSDG